MIDGRILADTDDEWIGEQCSERFEGQTVATGRREFGDDLTDLASFGSGPLGRCPALWRRPPAIRVVDIPMSAKSDGGS